MGRSFDKTGARLYHTDQGTGENLPFQDTPVGKGAGHNNGVFASYTDKELQTGIANTGNSPGPHGGNKGPLVFEPEGRVDTVRPFALNQPEILAAINGLRATVTAIFGEYNVASGEMPPHLLIGAVVLHERSVAAARREIAAKGIERDELMGFIREGQPPTYTGELTANAGDVLFFGGAHGNRKHVAMSLGGRKLPDETTAALRVMRNTAGQDIHVRNDGPFILLGSAQRFVPDAAKGPLQEAINAAIPIGTPITFLPSPALAAPGQPGAPA